MPPFKLSRGMTDVELDQNWYDITPEEGLALFSSKNMAEDIWNTSNDKFFSAYNDVLKLDPFKISSSENDDVLKLNPFKISSSEVTGPSQSAIDFMDSISKDKKDKNDSGFMNALMNNKSFGSNVAGLAGAFSSLVSLPSMFKNAKLQNEALQANINAFKEDRAYDKNRRENFSTAASRIA